MDEGVVPAHKRRCSGLLENGNPCEAKLNRVSGYCPQCGAPYNFKASLNPGDTIDDNYEIVGPMAYGGLGWIYLGRDRSLGRWCVLKGLINTTDPQLVALARQEAQFLASLNHPNIVQVFAFLRNGREGYINMELVNGKNLLQLRREHGGPLPVALAISYILNILPAFAYLDRRGLVFMDMKMENVMVMADDEGNSVTKLIDLGAVRRVDDQGGDLFATDGYAAPEVCSDPAYPTPVSDLYSVARALAVLVCDFAFQSDEYRFDLPSPGDAPVFAEHESLYRFLTKATAEAPDARFQTADEMGQQLLGILHEEIVGTPQEAFFEDYKSSIFESDIVHGVDLWEAGPSVQVLPPLKVDASDAGASVALSSLAIPDLDLRYDAFRSGFSTLNKAQGTSGGQGVFSLELRLRMVDTRIEQGKYREARTLLTEIEKTYPYEWKVAWYRGKALLAEAEGKEDSSLLRTRIQDALTQLDIVFGEVPGEIVPKLAMGIAYERIGDIDSAAAYYEAVLRVDEQSAGAAFGLCRVSFRQGNRPAAIEALARIPASSLRYAQSQLALAQVLIGDEKTPAAGIQDLARAVDVVRIVKSTVGGIQGHQLAASLYLAGARMIEGMPSLAASGTPFMDGQFTHKSLRAHAATEFRACAELTRDHDEKIQYVDRANATAPKRLW